MGEQFIDRASLAAIRSKLWHAAKEKQITLEDIQDRTGFSYSQVYRIVRGENKISVSTLITLRLTSEIHPKAALDIAVEIPEHQPSRKNFNS
jgi:transcriptional regulator with XRE-family HTH domain